jgi:hypothetical protein
LRSAVRRLGSARLRLCDIVTFMALLECRDSKPPNTKSSLSGPFPGGKSQTGIRRLWDNADRFDRCGHVSSSTSSERRPMVYLRRRQYAFASVLFFRSSHRSVTRGWRVLGRTKRIGRQPRYSGGTGSLALNYGPYAGLNGRQPGRPLSL